MLLVLSIEMIEIPCALYNNLAHLKQTYLKFHTNQVPMKPCNFQFYIRIATKSTKLREMHNTRCAKIGDLNQWLDSQSYQHAIKRGKVSETKRYNCKISQKLVLHFITNKAIDMIIINIVRIISRWSIT